MVKSKLINDLAGSFQLKIIRAVRSLERFGACYPFNKNQKKIERSLKKNKIDAGSLFFIDCVGSGEKGEGGLQIVPAKLDSLSCAISVLVLSLSADIPKEYARGMGFLEVSGFRLPVNVVPSQILNYYQLGQTPLFLSATWWRY